MDKIGNDSQVYLDVQGLEQLHSQLKTNPKAVEKEVAQQFEALLLQMVLKSMRDANKGFSSDLLPGNDMDLYQDLFDKQLTLLLSNRGMGIAESIQQNIDAKENKPVPLRGDITALVKPDKELKQPTTITHISPNFHLNRNDIATINQQSSQRAKQDAAEQQGPLAANDSIKTIFHTQHDFIQSLWHSAKEAASTLGVSPAVLLAQAALETDWGKKIISHANGVSSHNLFNIKADNNWQKSTMTVSTLEQKNGVLVKEKSNFRSYPTYTDSFNDYTQFIKSNSRYTKAVDNASTPKEYVQALQEAGYATDDKYASKIMTILNSPHFQTLLALNK